MAKTIQTRVQHKHDIEANWLLATNFIPLAGELIIYDVDDNHPKIRAKIGDGETLLSELPWALDEAALETATNNKLTELEADILDILNEKVQVTGIWVGTKAEYDTLNAEDKIAAGTVVIITDDNGTTTDATVATTAKLGTAVLGTMILGQE